MEDQLISIETAILAKEKGFQETNPTKHWVRRTLGDGIFPIESYSDNHKNYPAPTQSLLQRWLREKFDKQICIEPVGDSDGKTNGYFYVVITKSYSEANIESDTYLTYEEALEFGLQEALKCLK